MREIILLSLFFLAVSLFSIYLGGLTKVAIEKGEIEPVFENPSDYTNSLFMFLLILIGTIIVFLFVKVKLEFMKVVENIALFLLISTTFSYFLPSFTPFILSFLLILLSEIKPSFILKNFCIFLAIPSASAIIGASLDYKVLFLFFLILSIYDIVSVFLTKHMVYFAEKMLNRPTAFISVFPSGKIRKIKFTKGFRKVRVVALGTGDYFMSSSICVSLLQLGIKPAIITSLVNTLTIFLLFYLIQKREVSRPLPAIPFLFLSSIVSFLVSIYL